MAELTAHQTVRAIAGPIGTMGSLWMFAPETMEQGKELGYPNGFAYYIAGRGGVLGDCEADVVVSAFGYFQPALVAKMWPVGTAVRGARQAARDYAAACAAWGRTRLGDLDTATLEAFCRTAGALAAGADVAGMPLFAGWRAEPLVDDPAGRTMQLLHVLREWRGSAHVVATTAVGLTPLQSILSRDGAERAKMFGWPEPYADESRLAGRRGEAEALTDRLCETAVEATLTPAERGELVDAVKALQAVLAPKG